MGEAEKDLQEEHAFSEGESSECGRHKCETGDGKLRDGQQAANPDGIDADLSTEPMCGSNQRAEAGDAEILVPADAGVGSYLDDLKRVQAEYANYRRRSEKERKELADLVTAGVLLKLLPVLDDFERAKAAGDLPEGTPVRVVCDKLFTVLTQMGLEGFGKKGDEFDPKMHDAVAQVPALSDKEVNLVADVVELGYRLNGVEIRPAKVAVFVASES